MNKGDKMTKAIGYIMLVGYYLLFIMGTIYSGNLVYLVGAIFLPMVVIPGTLIMLLFVNPLSAIMQIFWVSVGLYLAAKED
jgi:hypothetical protein